MFPFADLFNLFNLCLQTVSQQNICTTCVRSLNLNLQPSNCLEHTYFNHPDLQFYTVKEDPLRHIIQKRITLVYKLLFFLEESLIHIGESQKELSAAILKLVCELRPAKVFPTINSLSKTSSKTEKRHTHLLKKILKPKLLKICSLAQFKPPHDAYLNQCGCQQQLNKEIENQTKSSTLVNFKNILSFDNSLCFECIAKTQCLHKPSASETYQFLHVHRHYQFQPIWRMLP